MLVVIIFKSFTYWNLRKTSAILQMANSNESFNNVSHIFTQIYQKSLISQEVHIRFSNDLASKSIETFT